MTIVKQIEDHGSTTTYEFNEQDYHFVVQMFSTKKVPEIFQEFEQNKGDSSAKIRSGLADIDKRYKPQVQEKEMKLRVAQRAIVQEEEAMRSDIQGSRYSGVPAHEATILELKQKALTAELDLINAQMNYQGAIAIYLRPVARGSQGSGATVKGMDYSLFLNIVRTIFYDWGVSKMGGDLVGQFSSQYAHANQEAVTYQDMAAEIQAKLDEFKQKAVAHFGGSPAPAEKPVVKTYQGGRPPVPPQYINLDPFGNSK